MRFSSWIPKATNTHSQYVILITFPLQQWLHERSRISHCTYYHCDVMYCFIALSYATFFKRPLCFGNFYQIRVCVSACACVRMLSWAWYFRCCNYDVSDKALPHHYNTGMDGERRDNYRFATVGSSSLSFSVRVWTDSVSMTHAIVIQELLDSQDLR